MENTTMRMPIRAASALGALALIMGCSSLPERVETLEEARELVQSLEQDPLTRDVAAERYERARQALARAEESYEDNEDLELIEHDAYLALRHAQIAEQQIAEQRARDELQAGESERNRVLLQAREREAQQAQQLAERRGVRLEEQQERAEQQQERVEELEASEQALEQELADLEAEQTERGLVMTLNEVLFDIDGTRLQPGAESTLQRIAQFLNEYPERNLLIEGHTDSTGAAAYNQQLSEQRAQAVRAALVERGIQSNRVQTRGLGESFPVASNESPTGRQLNRRVEIVVSDQDGRFADGAIRTASIDEQEDTTTR
jgi:outer membrane protein OmpA-like peptidoglycan-associated protein